MEKNSNLILNIITEIGTPIYNAKIKVVNTNTKIVINTNLSGIAKCNLNIGTYILYISANEFIKRKFKVNITERCSFVAIKLRYIENTLYGYIVKDDDDCKYENVEVSLLYEITEGNYIRVLQTNADENGKYEFKNIPRGKYKVEASKTE